MSRPTDLYRYYNKNGTLLYVGISLHTVKRQIQHKRNAKWYNDYYSQTRETFASREEALVAERRAIESEHPLFNVVHNARRPSRAEVCHSEDRRRKNPHVSYNATGKIEFNRRNLSEGLIACAANDESLIILAGELLEKHKSASFIRDALLKEYNEIEKLGFDYDPEGRDAPTYMTRADAEALVIEMRECGLYHKKFANPKLVLPAIDALFA